jgi:hypothetical protein
MEMDRLGGQDRLYRRNNRWKLLARYLPVLLGLPFAALSLPAAPAQSADEYQLKAVILYNFTRFITWPERAFANRTDPIRICILGANPFGDKLTTVLAGKEVGGRQLLAEVIPGVTQTSRCHILFVSSLQRTSLQMVLNRVSPAVLTVGEMPGFTEQGGIVNLNLEREHIYIEINQTTALRAELQISSRLLSLARVLR